MSPDQCAQPTETVTSRVWPATSIGVAATAARRRSAARSAPRLVGVGQDRDELVAAPASQLVAAASRLGEPARDLREHLVAGLVAERVVDHLEVVDVDARERQQATVADAERDLALELVPAVAAVGEPGQLVGQRLQRQPVVGVEERVVEPLDAERRLTRASSSAGSNGVRR